MDALPKSKIIRFNPNTLEEVRKDCNLGSPERINQSIDILNEWIKKQSHFTKKEFSRKYLEITLMTTKGLVERAKERIDKLCTFKTLLPRFFNMTNWKDDLMSNRKYIIQGHLKKMTESNHRVTFLKMFDGDFDPSVVVNVTRFCVSCSEYLRMHEYCSGFIIVIDCTETNILQMLTKMNVMEVRQAIDLVTNGYGMRIKGIHLVSSSKMVEALVSFLKQILTAKLGKRVFAHRSIETVYEYVSKDILPKEWGGNEESLEKLYDDWLDILSTEEHVDYLKDCLQAKTDESCRQQDKFNENYIGMPGSFRSLCVD